MKNFFKWGRGDENLGWGGVDFSVSFFEKGGCVCGWMGVFLKILRWEGVTIFCHFVV